MTCDRQGKYWLEMSLFLSLSLGKRSWWENRMLWYTFCDEKEEKLPPSFLSFTTDQFRGWKRNGLEWDDIIQESEEKERERKQAWFDVDSKSFGNEWHAKRGRDAALVSFEIDRRENKLDKIHQLVNPCLVLCVSGRILSSLTSLLLTQTLNPLLSQSLIQWLSDQNSFMKSNKKRRSEERKVNKITQNKKLVVCLWTDDG